MPARTEVAGSKISFNGVLTSVQPRIRLTRSFDEPSHTYLGYVLRVRGSLVSELARRRGVHHHPELVVGSETHWLASSQRTST